MLSFFVLLLVFLLIFVLQPSGVMVKIMVLCLDLLPAFLLFPCCQTVLLGFGPPIVVDSLNNCLASIRVQVLFCSYANLLPIFDRTLVSDQLSSNSLRGLLGIGGSGHWLSILSSRMKVLQSLALVFSQSIVALVNLVSYVGLDLSAKAHIINAPLRIIWQMIVSLGYLQETFLGLFVARVGSGVVLEGQFFVSPFDLVQIGSSPQT